MRPTGEFVENNIEPTALLQHRQAIETAVRPPDASFMEQLLHAATAYAAVESFVAAVPIASFDEFDKQYEEATRHAEDIFTMLQSYQKRIIRHEYTRYIATRLDKMIVEHRRAYDRLVESYIALKTYRTSHELNEYQVLLRIIAEDATTLGDKLRDNWIVMKEQIEGLTSSIEHEEKHLDNAELPEINSKDYGSEELKDMLIRLDSSLF